jgi:hypothetical protein
MRRIDLMCVLLCVCAAAGAGCTSVKIESLLPFTPTVDSLRVETKLANASAKAQLTATITPAGAKKAIWSGPLTSTSALLQNLPVNPWSPGSPNLYHLTVTATERGKGSATKTVRFGFRQIESKNGNVYLNGHPIFLRGLAINPPNRTVPPKVGHSRKFAYDYVKYLRGQNVNIIRLEPADQTWFDVCDELGMMVYQGFYSSPPTGLSKQQEAAQKKLATQDEASGKRLPRDFERSMAAYQKEFAKYVRHPSIVIYVLTNEMPYKGKEGELVHDFLTRAYDHLSKWDRTRLYIGNAGYGEGRQGDLNDVHRYWGWYYNSFTTYFNLRDPKLFGDFEKNQPFTFSEAVGCFTGPTGAWNYIERKQLAAGLGWTGHAADQPAEAQSYQGFMNKQALEIFRRMRATNPRISGIMPFTITFHHWRGIKTFDQMKPTAAAKQFGTSYSPVLLSFEHWQPQIYAGAKTPVFAHVVNDADDFRDLEDTLLEWTLVRADNGTPAASGQLEIPPVKYYGTWRGQIPVAPAADAPLGQYKLVGKLKRRGEVIATNETPIFVASKQWSHEGAPLRRDLHVIGDATAKALSKLAFDVRTANLARLDPANHVLVIGEEAWTEKLAAPAAKGQLRDFVHKGGRILILGQAHAKFDTSWLPSEVKLLATSVNDPGYFTVERPAADQTHVNPQRADHPVFAGLDRHRLALWSDYTSWDETKNGFPRISPMRFGFALARQDDLKHTAVLAEYDAALQGVALAEMFDGDGSILLCGFDLIGRCGVDPVADRLLVNMVCYMAGSAPHEIHPRVDHAIKWGEFPTERGVIGGPIFGLFRNTDWTPPPTDPKAQPLTDKQSGWNTKPSDQFLPRGVRPRGPYHYTFNCSPRDEDPKNPIGSGIFYATIPPGRKNVVTRVKNATTQPASLRVDVNNVEGETTTIPVNKTITIRTPIPGRATDVGVRYTGGKELIILETSFR